MVWYYHSENDVIAFKVTSELKIVKSCAILLENYFWCSFMCETRFTKWARVNVLPVENVGQKVQEKSFQRKHVIENLRESVFEYIRINDLQITSLTESILLLNQLKLFIQHFHSYRWIVLNELTWFSIVLPMCSSTLSSQE